MDDSPRVDGRAVWLRSLGWREIGDGNWSGPVVTTSGARYTPMSLDHAFEVAVKRCVIDGAFHVETAAGGVRLASEWRVVLPELDRPAST